MSDSDDQMIIWQDQDMPQESDGNESDSSLYMSEDSGNDIDADSDDDLDEEDDNPLQAYHGSLASTLIECWEGPPVFIPLLNYLKATQSKLKNLGPLQQLCIRCVSNNLDYFSKLHEPFECLPGSILLMLTKYLEEEKKLGPEIFPLVVTSRSKYLRIDLFRPQLLSLVFTTQEFSNLFRKISQKCKGQVEELYLAVNHPNFLEVSFNPYPSLNDINSVISNMNNLKELTLDIADVDDQTMAVIGSACTQLRLLNVESNVRVTDQGIRNLCERELPYGQCKQLEELNVIFTSVTVRGVICAYLNLPKITRVCYQKENSALLKFIQTYNTSKSLKLNKVVIRKKQEPYLSKICEILKDIETISIECQIILEPVYTLSKITSMTCQSLVPSIDVIRLTEHLGVKLTKIRIIRSFRESIDVSIVGYHCVNLEHLEFETRRNPPNECEYQLNNSHFSKLEYLSIKLANNRTSRFPSNVLKCMLSSNVLKFISFTNFNVQTNELFLNLLLQSRMEELIFSNLESLEIHNAVITVDMIKQWVCLSPKLKTLDIKGCRSSLQNKFINEELSSFILYNRLGHVKFTYTRPIVGFDDIDDGI